MSRLEFEEGRILAPEEVSKIEARKQAAIRVAQEAPGTRTEHLRLSIDFHISVAGTPPNDDGMNEPDPIYHARQVRLLAAVKSNPAVLKHWIHSLIVGQLYQYSWHEWDKLTGGEGAPRRTMLHPWHSQEELEERSWVNSSPTAVVRNLEPHHEAMQSRLLQAFG